jgi:NAD-dependent histone deacetylase SIR2
MSEAGKRLRDEDGENATAPTKRRRTSAEPKPRIIQHLDLSRPKVAEEQWDSMEKMLKVLSKCRKIVVIAGAGISVSAGIPDFRSSKGLFKSLKKQHNLKSSGKDLFDASVYKDENSTQNFHHMLRQLSSMAKDAKPTAFHNLLATLADEGRLLRLYTQNVDGLDTELPSLATTVPLNRKGPWPRTVQLHGGLQKMVCSKCNHLSDLDAELFDGPTPPSCEICEEQDNARTEHAGKRSHGIGRLRPRMVLYNEHNPDDEAIGAVVKSDMRTRPDALIVVGTTLKIPGVRRIVKEMGAIVRGRRDGLTMWMNMDGPPPGFDWDLIVKGPCDRVAEVASMQTDDEFKKSLQEPKAQAESADTPSKTIVSVPDFDNDDSMVSVDTPSKTLKVTGIPTKSKSTGAATEKKKPSIKFVKPNSTVLASRTKVGRKPKDPSATSSAQKRYSKKKAEQAAAKNNTKIGFGMGKSSTTAHVGGKEIGLESVGNKENVKAEMDGNVSGLSIVLPNSPNVLGMDNSLIESPVASEASISPTTGRPRKASIEFLLN